MTTFIFDITTSARWSGHPVGIVRVERELARRARTYLGDDCLFSVYDLTTGQFYVVGDQYVEPILNGEVSIEFAPVDVTPAKTRIRGRLRSLALSSPRAYQFIQRLRGAKLTLAEIHFLRERLRATKSNRIQGAHRLIALSEATTKPAKLDENTVIVSGGLDWEHKNIRNIYYSKKEFGFKYIPIIYDLIPIYLPHYVVPFYVTLLCEYFGELLWTADGYLCISDSTRIDLLRFQDDNQIPHLPATAFPLGSDIGSKGDNEVLPNRLRDKRFVLYVSTIEPRKNHRTAYEAWCHGLLSGKIDPARDRMVFVGRQGWNVGDLIQEIKINPITRETIVILENVSDALLKTLYQESAFVIFPSYYEGFGLPLVEAFANKKLCLTSGAGALKEIGSPFRIDIDPRDILQWSGKISDLLNSPDQVRNVEDTISASYQSISWDQSAQLFFQSLKKMVGVE